jgi:hypothetical protein
MWGRCGGRSSQFDLRQNVCRHDATFVTSSVFSSSEAGGAHDYMVNAVVAFNALSADFLVDRSGNSVTKS